MQSFRIFVELAFLASVAFAYDLGVTHNYEYETSVLVDEGCSDGADGNLTGHGLWAKVQLTAIWKDPKSSQRMLLKVEVSEPKLLASKKSTLGVRRSDLEKIPTTESFFLLENGRAEKFWDNPGEHVVLRNVKRSVATLLQAARKDGKEKMAGVSGDCDVLYKVDGITSRRSLGNCHHPIQDSVASQPFGVRSSSVRRSVGIDCDFKEDGGAISKCVANERVKTFSNLWSRSSICIHSTSLFLHESTSGGKKRPKTTDYAKTIEELMKRGDLVEGTLHSVSTSAQDEPTTNVMDATKSFQESLKSANLAKLKSASAFFKLLPTFRAASKQDILKVLENKKLAQVLPQLLDLVAASGSADSVGAALTYFNSLKDYDPKLERYLISLSVMPRPEGFVLEEIKAFLDGGDHHEKIQATLITTLGALLGTYARSGHRADPKVVKETLDYLEGALKACQSETCVQTRLRGLRNAAQPSSTPLLLQYALKGGKPSLEALLALRNIPSAHQNHDPLLKVYHQVGARQDRSARAVAAEILLRGNTEDGILKSILASLSDQSDQEFSSFVLSKVFRLMDEDKALKSRILKMLPEREISHYYSLSQKGKSSLFKRQLMSTDGLNVTYGLETELIEGGLLKRSSFDVEFESGGQVSNLLSVGMFADGLASFASVGDEGGDPAAGMELTLLGASLRPYVFFSSTSELMGHAWSGTASEQTPALQGIFSLCDDPHLAVLHNGMVARLELRGVMSADLSGAIQISLWNRNSQSKVKNSAALLLKGSASVDAGFARTRGEYLFYGHSTIDFSTDLEFAEVPVKMCLHMEQPDLTLRHDFQRSVEVGEAKFSSKKTKKRKRFIPGRSYALHQNNNELCRIMKTSEGN